MLTRSHQLRILVQRYKSRSFCSNLKNTPLSFGTPLPEFSSTVPKAGFALQVNEDAAKKSSFEHFELLPELQASIVNSGILVPTSAQLYGIPRLLSGENVLLISQTGKGKTLAYLIPVVNKLLKENKDKLYPMPNAPRAIIVVPTRELAVQTLTVVRKMFGTSVSSVGLAPGLVSFVKEKRVLSSTGADLVVATPSRLQLHLKNPSGLKLNHLKSLVFDEADTICDSVYEKDARELIARVLRKKSDPCQIAIVGATKTGGVNAFVASVPGLHVTPVVTTDAHLIVPHLDQVFVPVGRRKRTSCLIEALGEQTVPGAKTLVFTNSVKTCNFVSRYLKEQGIAKTASFHGELPYKLRSSNYKLFANPKSGCDIMVCTNLASRGIDVDSINHVVMYNFPHTLADYIHRAGRTARAGRLGKVTALYTKQNVALARQIQEAMREGKPIQYKKHVQTKSCLRRSVQLEKYKAALDELKKKRKGKSIRGLRAVMGLPPHLGIGSVERRKVAKEWEAAESDKKRLEFMKKRKRIGKRDPPPKLPDKGVEASETGSVSRVARNRQTGDLQMVTARRSYS